MQGGFFSTVQMRILGALVLLMVMIALGSYASLNFEKIQFLDPSPATISVAGEGEVLAVPDVGQFTFAVNAEADDAATAQEESASKVNDILAYLKEQGVEEKDIKTTNYNLSPKWRWEERVCPVGSYCPPGERVQDGVTVTQRVEVKVRDTEQAGQLLAGVGERGATDISNLRFTVDDTDELKAEARAQAIADAQEKAATLATQLGVRVVRLAHYNEQSDGFMPYTERFMAADAAEGLGGGPQLPTGEESTVVRVNVTYEVE